MSSPQIERKLAAIMFTDIAGYTESMSKSESKTLNLLEKKRSILQPLLKKYKGTFVKEIGDGTLSYFESAVNAATCAVKLQETTYDDKEMNIRVGIHIGDIVFKDGDVFGVGVNVASRLESIAPAGGVCVSKSVFDELSNQDDFDGIELGLQSLKGVGRLIEVFGLKGDKLSEPDPQKYQENKVAVHSDDEVPSIAIIPFRNKGKEEDAFYAYGICADLISDCSSAGLIRVASLKDIEKFEHWDKLKADELASKLLVRYVAQGTLWKMDDMFQLSVELYDTKDKKVVWSDRWEEKWDNLPTIKGSLSDGLLKALDTKPKVEKQADTKYSEAYEYYLRAKYKYRKFQNLDDMEIARSLLEKAIQIDDDMINAKRLLGTTYHQIGKYSKAMEIFKIALTQSELVDNKEENGNLHLNIGSLYGDKGNLDNAQTHYNHSLKIFETLGNRNGIAYSLGNLGWSFEKQGNYELAFNHYRRSYTICEERDDKWAMGVSFSNMGSIFIKKGEFDRALEYSLQSYKTREKINDKSGLGHTLNNIGIINFYKNDYTKAIRNLNDSLKISKQLNHPAQSTLETVVFQKLTMRKLGDKYDVNEIHSLIKESENIEFELNLRLYQLLNDNSYLETAYNQVQEKADNLEPDVKAKFLSYPIPKVIVEEWEKVEMLIDHL